MNGFVAYLNSLNNANSSNENALAESQVTNAFYKKFHIDRNLGNYLANKLQEKPTCVILTGHAGDGKTSLIYQILKRFGIFNEKEGLKKYDQNFSVDLSRDLFYIKDMSELTEELQIDLLMRALNGTKQDISSIVVSNTGPLISTFKHMIRSGQIRDISEDMVEMNLLELMDENKGIEVCIGDFEILLVNMARIDNVILVPNIIDKITNDENWEICRSSCEKCNNCPIFNNYKTLKENKDHVTKFITSFYRWLFELDRRLTIRQILAHLSYSLTGNYLCETISEQSRIEEKFKYHFSNLFFGYDGLHKYNEAVQIKAIQEIQKLELDNKETIYDYDFFVKDDFNHLTPSMREVISEIWNEKLLKYKLKPNEYMQSEEPFLLRKAVRRMNILFGQYDKTTFNILLDELFSPVFGNYLSYRERIWNIKERRSLKSIIYKALHYIMVGTHSDKESEKIYLPLHRQGTGMQNVQLLLGELDESSFSLHQEYIESVFDIEENHYRLFIEFTNGKRYLISLMLLDYFDHLAKGAVSTKLNPSLSHGIDKMKSQLLRDYMYHNNDEIIRLLIHTLKGPKLIKLQIDDSEIFVD